MTSDRLKWWEELPLGLALLAQSYVVGLWYFATVRGPDWRADLVIAVGAGLALDLIVVTTVMGRRAGRSSGWSWATSFGAFGCSALIALDRYGWEYRSLLHVAFPLVVFLYSQHLATASRSAPEALTALDTDQAPALELSDRLLLIQQPTSYPCPHCERPLKSKQARGAAVANGYCPACKSERKVA